ncbi:hypothetical protein PV05_01326 [Exophiala xenobiotica]|uniref:Uncharacterized protein n=1 Tax=Exophiala xenobiotica TaxID=348802 RepID=A0A0D2FM01_9EURO|nr:uncharacterized protein PV05_01326 [Exophiala xenobiotica]KIW61169.1 hypothetical protein PV05_01326 [Exophiala xenobiotica]
MELSSPTKQHYNRIIQQRDEFKFDNHIPLDQRPRYDSLSTRDTGRGPSMPTDLSTHGQALMEKQDGGRKIILGSVAIIVILMLGLAGLALGLVVAHEVKEPVQTSNNTLAARGTDLDGNAYYVDFNPTTLVTIASWSSTVAPLLAVCAMTLVSFPIANQLKAHSQMAGFDLPTPYQFGLLLETMTGGITPLFGFLGYRNWPHKEKMASSVRTALALLTVFTVLGYTIAAVDTWLHLVMEAVNIELVEPQVPVMGLGRGLPNGPCSDESADQFDAGDCIISSGANVFLVGANEAARVMSNTSSTNAIYDTYIDGRHMAYLGPSDSPAGLDYRAESLAMHTSCTQIGRQCDLHTEAGALEPFNCTDSFYGNLAVPSINGEEADGVTGLALRSAGIVFFRDAALTKLANVSSNSGEATFLTRPSNPHHIGVWAHVELPANEQQAADGNVVVPEHGGTSWLLNCTATAYLISYDFVNGSIQHATADIANGSVGTILNSGNYYGFGKVALETAAYSASQFNDTQQMADSWAKAYSKAALALSAGVMTGRADLEEQQRSTRLVARVPKAPLFSLVGLNSLYAILGVLLAVLALGSHPKETNELRERLSISGLVAACFEGESADKAVNKKREMFAEYEGIDTGRVGIEESGRHGGYVFRLRQGLKQQVS